MRYSGADLCLALMSMEERISVCFCFTLALLLNLLSPSLCHHPCLFSIRWSFSFSSLKYSHFYYVFQYLCPSLCMLLFRLCQPCPSIACFRERECRVSPFPPSFSTSFPVSLLSVGTTIGIIMGK